MWGRNSELSETLAQKQAPGHRHDSPNVHGFNRMPWPWYARMAPTRSEARNEAHSGGDKPSYADREYREWLGARHKAFCKHIWRAWKCNWKDPLLEDRESRPERTAIGRFRRAAEKAGWRLPMSMKAKRTDVFSVNHSRAHPIGYELEIPLKIWAEGRMITDGVHMYRQSNGYTVIPMFDLRRSEAIRRYPKLLAQALQLMASPLNRRRITMTTARRLKIGGPRNSRCIHVAGMHTDHNSFVLPLAWKKTAELSQ